MQWPLEEGDGNGRSRRATDDAVRVQGAADYSVDTGLAANGAEALVVFRGGEGVAYRVLACKPGNRCGISATVEKFDAGEEAKCDHCNAQKHRLVCPCPSCQAQRAAAVRAVPAGPTTT